MSTLSERLNELIHSRTYMVGMYEDEQKIILDALALAKRFQNAPVVKVRGKVGELCMLPVSHGFIGQRVRILLDTDPNPHQ